jgi:transcriptional regulator with XRE-family HTH domain
MIVKTQLGEWMEKERLARGLTKGKISETIGISVGQYSAYVAGKSLPRGKTLEKIAAAYGRPFEEVRAMLAPLAAEAAPAAPAVPAAPVAEVRVEADGTLAARVALLEAKLDYAVALLERISRG